MSYTAGSGVVPPVSLGTVDRHGVVIRCEPSAPEALATTSGASRTYAGGPTITDTNEPKQTPTDRLIHSLGNHLTLIETHAAQCRQQLAELALTIEAAKS
jgi:hypothetical protein